MATRLQPFDPASGHSALANAIFWGKSRAHMLRRAALNALSPHPPIVRATGGGESLAVDESPLHTAADPRERALELGKIQNLRVAARAIDGILLDRGRIFSFWRAVGRPTRAKGYVIGRELRQGCMVPTVAGGICQLTNALSRVAQAAGMDIVERHRHSAAVDGLVIDDTTDATVFWNYVDFRFRATASVRLSAHLTENALIVGLEKPR